MSIVYIYVYLFMRINAYISQKCCGVEINQELKSRCEYEMIISYSATRAEWLDNELGSYNK